MSTLAQSYTISPSPVDGVHTRVPSQLAATLIDMAASADSQAGRAAAFSTATSSQLFVLADQLRTMAQSAQLEEDREAAFTVLDDARARVARAMLQLDARERSIAKPAPARQ